MKNQRSYIDREHFGPMPPHQPRLYPFVCAIPLMKCLSDLAELELEPSLEIILGAYGGNLLDWKPYQNI
jgi:hypothetical protein